MTIPRACACALAAFIQVAAVSAADSPADHPAGTDNAGAPEEPADYWTGPINGPVPTTLAGATVTDTQTLSSLVKDGNAVLVEVSNLPHRPEKLAAGAVWLPKPHQVIPGSLWIPGAGVGNIAPDVDATYRDQLAHATNNDLDRLIVVYCHERCWLSWNAAKRAVRYGYRNVHWYPDGIEGWTAAGLKSVIAEPAVGPFGSPTAGSQ